MEQVLEIALKLLLALIFSGLIGLERDLTGHEAGFRTQILVGVGAATFVMIGDYSAMDAGDMSRLLSGVITGVGFLGAGAIIKEGMNVKGLTTAASIWVTAAIGSAVGWNKFDLALLAFAFTIVSLSILGIMERRLDLKPTGGIMKLFLSDDSTSMERVMATLRKKGLFIRRTVVDTREGSMVLTLEVEVPRRVRMDRLLKEVQRKGHVRKIEWNDLEDFNQLQFIS